MIRSKGSVWSFKDFTENDVVVAKRPRYDSNELPSLSGETKILQVFKNKKPREFEQPSELEIPLVSEKAHKELVKFEQNGSLLSKIDGQKTSKKVTWGANPGPIIIPNREELDCSDLWWDDLKSRGFEKMKERNDEGELKEFADSMLSLQGLLPEEKLQQYTYEALTASLLVDQTGSGYEGDEIDPDNEF